MRRATIPSRASAMILAALLAGCGLLETARLTVVIRNNTDVPALVQMAEFDYATGEFGAPLGDATSIPAGKRATLHVRLPAAGPWALRINDLPGVTSMGLAEAERGLPGEGLPTYSITVDEGALSTSVTRGDAVSGETSAPLPD